MWWYYEKYLTNKNIILLSITLVLILMFFNPFIYFKLEGSKNITINLNDENSLPQVNAYIFNNDITNKIKKVVKLTIKK